MSPLLEPSAPARLPAPADNVAIATRRLDPGTVIAIGGEARTLAHTILEGHRFAVRPIRRGEPLLSWSLPFGIATRDIAPGEYVCNRLMLQSLAQRSVAGMVLPAEFNFEDRIVPYAFDESSFRPAAQVDPAAGGESEVFLGFPRGQGRGYGTRNHIVLLGTSSRTSSFVRGLAARLHALGQAYPGFDGIVAVAHTEGDVPGRPNNIIELRRALAGFMVNPNVGAVLAVDTGTEAFNNSALQAFLAENNYPLSDLPHHFLTVRGGTAAAMAEAETIVRGWLPEVAGLARQPCPLSGLRIALQCGGSDAFSGISANPLVGSVGKEVIRHGGAVNLAETDELVGAESYILARVSNAATARIFLEKIARFKERLSWHGATVEGNPSGGNRLRGLYNIVLKSLGAAMKKDPAVRLDHVIDYGVLMRQPGFYFMDSPGNDLESVAGQMGAGCNLIWFTTGNGSITNFPFVPTVKFTTTSRRHQLLSNEMDVNAGPYLEGKSMEELTAETFALVREIASGRRTKGELAGHSQVSIWRNWPQTDASRIAAIRSRPAPTGKPLPIAPPPAPAPGRTFPAFVNAEGVRAADRIGLVLPTSLCSSQIARLAAERLNARRSGLNGITRFVALPHTEGCGFSGETVIPLLQRTYAAYAGHPSVATTLFLEHGCEKVPNDVVRNYLTERGIDPERYGWASVQLDGGIERVLDKIDAWFAARAPALPGTPRAPATIGALRLGLLTDGPVTPATAEALAGLTQAIVGAGGSVLLSATAPLLRDRAFLDRTTGSTPISPTLAYGQAMAAPGFHVMDTESEHWVENLTGLGGCGAQVFLAVVRDEARQGHPFIPLLQVAEASARGAMPASDVDAFLAGNAEQDMAAMTDLVLDAAGGLRPTVAAGNGMVDFQFSRGALGVST